MSSFRPAEARRYSTRSPAVGAVPSSTFTAAATGAMRTVATPVVWRGGGVRGGRRSAGIGSLKRVARHTGTQNGSVVRDNARPAWVINLPLSRAGRHTSSATARCKMKNGQMKLQLAPEYGGSYTRLRLCGSVPTAIPRAAARRLVRGLAFWSGWPVECVLSVDMEGANWCEWWTDLLVGIPARHLEVRFRARGRRRESSRTDR